MRRIELDKRRSDDPDADDNSFNGDNIESQDSVEARDAKENIIDPEHEEDSDAEEEDIDDLGLVEAANDVDRLQHALSDKSQAYPGARGLDETDDGATSEGDIADTSSARAMRHNSINNKRAKIDEPNEKQKPPQKSKKAQPIDLADDSSEDDYPKTAEKKKKGKLPETLSFTFKYAVITNKKKPIKDSDFSSPEMATLHRIDLEDDAGCDPWTGAIEDAIMAISAMSKYGDLEVDEFGYYAKSARVQIRSDAAANAIVDEKKLLTSNNQPPMFYAIFKPTGDIGDETNDGAGSFTYDGNAHKDAQKHNMYQMAIDDVLTTMSQTLANENGVQLFKRTNGGTPVCPRDHPARNHPARTRRTRTPAPRPPRCPGTWRGSPHHRKRSQTTSQNSRGRRQPTGSNRWRATSAGRPTTETRRSSRTAKAFRSPSRRLPYCRRTATCSSCCRRAPTTAS